mmetsp:Transcript_35258/g.26297  ORF Transcript_35258/g.26297 Transcript_35258/m.26297 type:complete len:102 (-) Transcript_35258:526-831(-)
MEKLLHYSLIQKKDDDESLRGRVLYSLPPFMSNYAEAKIPEDDKIELHNNICHYYAGLCKKILDKNGKTVSAAELECRPSELHHQIMESLLEHETNIWAAI